MAPKRKLVPLFKIITLLIVATGLFAGGVLVGQKNAEVPASTDLDYSSVTQVYDLLKQNFDGSLDQTKLLDGLKKGLVNATEDPYTTYFNPKEAKSFEEQLSGSFSGIGAELGTDKQKRIVVISPLAGYPAAKAGLKPKDVIAAVDGQSTDSQSVDAVVQSIRGEIGTKVKLTIIRGSQPPFSVTITRAEITIPSVESNMEDEIGYLKISQFSDNTVKLARQAAADFIEQKTAGIILDLRGNPGGFLDGAVKLSGLWLDSGQTVVEQRRGGTVVSTATANGGNILKGLPTVVIIDAGSASASEITAGALRDNDAATIVGVTSFGKGSVQTVTKLGDGAEVKITVARWYTPDGKNIDKHGIKPDVVVRLTAADQQADRDPQKAKAIEILQRKISQAL
ncbi:S41 family peptidase [Candidatus Saccharibacteria bacterium]|nr:S41 family peptidase [Candidatus Saccharibacteria bacterium]